MSNKCMICSLSHMESKNRKLPNHCYGELPSCECACRHEKVKNAEELVQRFEARQQQGLIR